MEYTGVFARRLLPPLADEMRKQLESSIGAVARPVQTPLSEGCEITLDEGLVQVRFNFMYPNAGATMHVAVDSKRLASGVQSVLELTRPHMDRHYAELYPTVNMGSTEYYVVPHEAYYWMVCGLNQYVGPHFTMSYPVLVSKNSLATPDIEYLEQEKLMEALQLFEL